MLPEIECVIDWAPELKSISRQSTKQRRRHIWSHLKICQKWSASRLADMSGDELRGTYERRGERCCKKRRMRRRSGYMWEFLKERVRASTFPAGWSASSGSPEVWLGEEGRPGLVSWLARLLAATFSTCLASWQPCPAPRPPPCPQEPDARGPARLATLKFYPYKFPRFSRTHDFLQDLDVWPNPHKTDTVCSSLSLNSLIHCLDNVYNGRKMGFQTFAVSLVVEWTLMWHGPFQCLLSCC